MDYFFDCSPHGKTFPLIRALNWPSHSFSMSPLLFEMDSIVAVTETRFMWEDQGLELVCCSIDVFDCGDIGNSNSFSWYGLQGHYFFLYRLVSQPIQLDLCKFIRVRGKYSRWCGWSEDWEAASIWGRSQRDLLSPLVLCCECNLWISFHFHKKTIKQLQRAQLPITAVAVGFVKWAKFIVEDIIKLIICYLNLLNTPTCWNILALLVILRSVPKLSTNRFPSYSSMSKIRAQRRSQIVCPVSEWVWINIALPIISILSQRVSLMDDEGSHWRLPRVWSNNGSHTGQIGHAHSRRRDATLHFGSNHYCTLNNLMRWNTLSKNRHILI